MWEWLEKMPHVSIFRFERTTKTLHCVITQPSTEWMAHAMNYYRHCQHPGRTRHPSRPYRCPSGRGLLSWDNYRRRRPHCLCSFHPPSPLCPRSPGQGLAPRGSCPTADNYCTQLSSSKWAIFLLELYEKYYQLQRTWKIFKMSKDWKPTVIFDMYRISELNRIFKLKEKFALGSEKLSSEKST